MKPSIKNQSLLSVEKVRDMFFYDHSTGIFTTKTFHSRRPIGSMAGQIRNGYIKINIGGKRYSAHRLAWLLVYGEWPAMHIDHINGNRSDNRIANLRQVTCRQNLWNLKRPKTNTSGFKGVINEKGRWRARIRYFGKLISLGFYDEITDAAKAYDAAALKMFDEYARLNFPQ
jgi:hypothetical protein